MTPADCILFSGGAAGAEAEFGACAERHGIEEVNFTFDGHHHRSAARRARAQSRGAAGGRRQPRIRVAADAPAVHGQPDAAPGAADALVSGEQRAGDLRHRHDPGRRHRAGRHGLGRRSSRSCATSRCTSSTRTRVAGSGGRARVASLAAEGPVIMHPHFTGTGTRSLQPNGRRAIEQLYDRSFAG